MVAEDLIDIFLNTKLGKMWFSVLRLPVGTEGSKGVFEIQLWSLAFDCSHDLDAGCLDDSSLTTAETSAVDFDEAVHESKCQIMSPFACLEMKCVQTLLWVEQEVVVEDLMEVSEKFTLEWEGEHSTMGQEQTVGLRLIIAGLRSNSGHEVFFTGYLLSGILFQSSEYAHSPQGMEKEPTPVRWVRWRLHPQSICQLSRNVATLCFLFEITSHVRIIMDVVELLDIFEEFRHSEDDKFVSALRTEAFHVNDAPRLGKEFQELHDFSIGDMKVLGNGLQLWQRDVHLPGVPEVRAQEYPLHR